MRKSKGDRIVVESDGSGSAGVPEGQRLLIGEMLRRNAEAVPEAAAASMGEVVVSYGDLDRDSNRLAAALQGELGIGYGDRVVCWSDTALEVLPLFAALARLGAVFSPLNARLGPDEAGEVAALARGALLVTDDPAASSRRASSLDSRMLASLLRP